MAGADLQSLRAVMEFRECLQWLSAGAVEEIEEMVGSAGQVVTVGERYLEQRRDALWWAEEELRSRDASGQETGANGRAVLEDARNEAARAEADVAEARAAYASFRRAVDVLARELIREISNARESLDERIEAAERYRALAPSDSGGMSGTGFAPGNRSYTGTEVRRGGTEVSGERSPRLEGRGAEIAPREGGGAQGSGGVEVSRGAGVPAGAAGSSLRGSSVRGLPDLPNGLRWVPMGSIGWDGVDGIPGVPGELEFRKASKEAIREMLETFEAEVVPMLYRNGAVSVEELSRRDQQDGRGGTSRSLLLCYDSMIGSGRQSDVIVFQSTSGGARDEHPAARIRSFQEGREARAAGWGAQANPYREVGREGAAGVWDQGWQWEDGGGRLAFTSGRHRALVARELGWKFIPARVLGEGRR